MPVPGPSCNKGKQCPEPDRDFMRDPSSDNPPPEPKNSKKKKSRKKKPKDSDSNDSGDDSDPSSRHRPQNFEPAVMADYHSWEATPLFLLHWEEFVYELKENFGPVDAEEDAEEDLEDLKMGSNHYVTKYFIAFAKYKARTQFNDKGYYHVVKNTLPNRILDDLAKIYPKPKTYELLHQIVLQIDQHYWQSHHEESR
ncbi:hypothetical protein M422DRAFT_272083 [Sphaerobolus stellatus SS14]|uniref:Retrotransposon gag domain-containing protein n=1 Tax=Sphaerobolus stellatus (strain SS14) TaxID=990650 RepID=A0A0C9UND5_SPHS4|nr:hypothetical protein M422DRAFT_272083 [Sphaerobolus stellatus SS14]